MINIKNHFMIFALIIMFLIIQSVFAITTPRGSQVSDTCNPSEYDDPDYIAYLNNYYDEAYPNATRLGDASNTYNCHGYAWHMSEGGGTIMIGCNSSTAEDIYWTDGSYDEMPSVAYATKVRYSGNHSAITTSGGNYISKWGGGPLYRHAPNYCPGSYGSSYKYYVRSVDVPQDYSSIADASDEAVIGQTIIVSSGTHTESNSSTINSGVTLQLNPGVTLRMANGKKLTINGTLSAQGTYNNRITFQSSSGTWYGIELNYCSSTTLKYCNIQNASIGVKAYHTALTVDNCTFTSNTIGIKYDNQSSGYVKYSTISSTGSSGIACAQNSNPIIRSYNRIWNNSAIGVYSDFNSLPELCTLLHYGNNSIKNNYPDDVFSDNTNSLYAQKNYWGSSSPNPYVSENVIWEPYLTSDPTGGGLLKPFTDDLATNDSFTHTVNDTIGKNEFDKTYQVYLSGDYAGALSLFDQLVNKYPENHTGLQSLALIDYCYQNLDNIIASSNYLNQVAASYASKEISGLAKSIAVGHLVKSGDYDVAIGYSQQILTEFMDKVIAEYALYDLGTIYWYFKEDYATGARNITAN